MTNLATGILAAAILPGLNKRKKEMNRWLCVIQILWSGVLLLYYLPYLPQIWEGSGDYFVPTCMVILGLWGVRVGCFAAASVGAVLLWIALPLFAGVGFAAMEDINWKMAVRDGVEFHPAVVTACLLPGAMRSLPIDNGRKMGKWYLLIPGIAAAFCLIIRGCISGTLADTTGFTQMSKSLEIFGRVMRLEAIAAMALTLSFYCVVSVLLAGVSQDAIWIVPGREGWMLGVIGITVIVGMLCKITISDAFAAFGSVICWVILPFVTQLIEREKKL